MVGTLKEYFVATETRELFTYQLVGTVRHRSAMKISKGSGGGSLGCSPLMERRLITGVAEGRKDFGSQAAGNSSGRTSRAER